MMRYLTAGCVIFGALLLTRPAPFAEQASSQPEASARERAYRANNVGVAHLEQFDYPGAERSFREALTLEPDLALARLNLAIALYYAGRPADAVPEAKAAATRLPSSPQAHYVLGLAARGSDGLDEAVAAFRRVLVLDPNDAGAKIQLGQIQLQQRVYDEALKLFQEALVAEPYNVTAAYSVALALTRSGKPEEGRTAMQKFETLRDSPYGFTYAQTYLSQGKYAEAIASTGAEADLVDPAVPAVTFADATSTMLPGVTISGGGAAFALVDLDNDDDVDAVEVGATGVRLLRNSTDGVFADDTARTKLTVPAGQAWAGVLPFDYDNDARPDLLVVGSGSRHVLLHQTAEGAFEDVTAAAQLPAPGQGVTSAAAADVDHDGDTDLFIAGASAQLLQNNGNGTFTDITARAGLGVNVTALAAAASDVDNRRDIDLLVAGRSRILLFRNMRDGSFRESAQEAGLTGPATPAGNAPALAAGDLNKDGYIDFFFSQAGGGTLAMSDGQGRFRAGPAPQGTADAVAASFVDYDNDGLLDLLTAHRQGLRLFRNVGTGWTDVTAASRLPSAADGAAGLTVTALGVADLNRDGSADIVVQTNRGLRMLRNDGGRHASLRVRLTSRVSNRSAVGAKVEMRSGSLRQMLETSSSSPAVAPADLIFGLGRRGTADVVRVLWPSGILQAETTIEATTTGNRRGAMAITELDRKPSSCPYLFTWNGERFEFVTDFMGGGEMGAWLAPAMWNQPDADEYVRIRGDQLEPRNGRYELRLTNELEEALFYDRVELLAVDHAPDVEVYPNEGLRSAPRPPFTLTSVRRARPPVRAVDGHGHDVLPMLAHMDRRYPDDFQLLPIRGYAEPHELIVDVGGVSNPVLLLTGWTDYAFSNDNVAASQRPVAMSPPSLQVRDRRGAWKTVISETGFPVGRPQTIVIDLTGKFLSASRDVRIVTNMRIYWDQVQVAERVATAERPRLSRLDPNTAELRWRGLSAETTPDGREPFGYDYHRVSTIQPWKVMVGSYTRLGDVRPLLGRVDDRFVISQPGDELALSFDVPPATEPGSTRTFLLFVHGYSKEMNPRSASPDTVGPLPFRGMSGYPYGDREHYPRTREHRDYQDRYNTRLVLRPLPSIDRAAPGASTGSKASEGSKER